MHTLWTDGETAVRVVHLNASDEINRLIEMFEGIAEAEDWKPEGALRKNLEQSVFFALEEDGGLIAGIQLTHSAGGSPGIAETAAKEAWMPFQSVWPEVTPDSKAKSAHVPVLAMHAAHRGRPLLFWMLAVELWRYCVGQSIATLYLEATPRVRAVYSRLGWPLEVIGQPRYHWGEECVLCTLGVAEAAQAILLRAEKSPCYRKIAAQAFRVAIFTDKEHPVPLDASHATEGLPS